MNIELQKVWKKILHKEKRKHICRVSYDLLDKEETNGSDDEC